MLGTFDDSPADALARDGEREATLICFRVAASGLTLCGLGSAFWGPASGLMVAHIAAPQHPR